MSHELQVIGKVLHLVVSVMQVVDDANVVSIVCSPQMFADGNEILRLATPSTMVVEAKLQSKISCLLNQRHQGFCGSFNSFALGFGKTASRLHDAMVRALDDVIPETGYRAVVAIADGTDRGSDYSYQVVVRRFRDSSVPLYVIGYGCGRAERGLSSLGTQSGGLFLSAENGLELNATCQSLLRRLSNYYSISYEHEEKLDGPLRLWIDGPSGAGELSVEPVVARG